MVTLINTNPVGAVEVPLLRQYGHYSLAAGEEFDVPREVADQLLAQAGNYAEKPAEEPADKPAPRPAKKTAAAKKSAEETEKTEG